METDRSINFGTLLVTHGDVLGQWVQACTGQTVLSVENCAWAAYRTAKGPLGSQNLPDAADSWGVTAMSIE